MSGLRLVRCNRLESLADELAQQVERTMPADPFEPIEIVVGSRTMQRWLQHALAERLGICANIFFTFPLVNETGDGCQAPLTSNCTNIETNAEERQPVDVQIARFAARR